MAGKCGYLKRSTSKLRSLQNAAQRSQITVQLCRHNFNVFTFAITGRLVSRILKIPLSLTDRHLDHGEQDSWVTVTLQLCFRHCNQIVCPEEDRINKPQRPIPAGLMTVNQAKIGLWLAWIVTAIALYLFAGVWELFRPTILLVPKFFVEHSQESWGLTEGFLPTGWLG